MELALYNSGSYTSVIEAHKQKAIHHIATLNDLDDSITVEELNCSDHMGMIELNRAWACATNALNVTDQLTNMVALIVIADEPKFEMTGSYKWINVMNHNEIRKEAEIESLKHIKSLELRLYIVNNGTDFTLTIIDKFGNVSINEGLHSDDEYDVIINGETFDFLISNYGDCYINFFNLVDYGNGNVTNREFEFNVIAEEIDPVCIATKIEQAKMLKIHKELIAIEKWSGEAYQRPLCEGAGPEGDDIYQALHNIRKIIGIGVDEYHREVKEATTEYNNQTC